MILGVFLDLLWDVYSFLVFVILCMVKHSVRLGLLVLLCVCLALCEFGCVFVVGVFWYCLCVLILLLSVRGYLEYDSICLWLLF